ncbi:MerR family transcriptional regulator [Aquabacterium sp. A7-Y]|uniref:MerR family transcriptional regulator n=1 Tax=Aquabacterium sp. A7-Y TaxID=1349605 RepID=UPI00223CA22D|nr:MerR family transcriptional regulator [Aquabacterium sp. A7-Y]MCW7536855.1 MerR family transcriptional regulator [Aquabacterium sp. A7-Y]
MEKALPAIPAKRYFTIGEVSELCGVKPYVLRYWEQEFTQLKPMKRRGNRRYYQHHEVLLIRRIRELLYEQGFTISGARNRLAEMGQHAKAEPLAAVPAEAEAEVALQAGLAEALPTPEVIEIGARIEAAVQPDVSTPAAGELATPVREAYNLSQLRQELLSIRMLLAS